MDRVIKGTFIVFDFFWWKKQKSQSQGDIRSKSSKKQKTVLRVYRDNSLSFSLLNHKKIIPKNQTPTVGFGKFFWWIFIFWKNSVLRKLLYKVFWKREKNSKKLPKTFQISSPTYLAHPAWIFPDGVSSWFLLVWKQSASINLVDDLL